MTAALSIRAAGEVDLPAILAIYNDAVENTTAIWNETLSDLEGRRTWWRERVARGFPVLVADVGGEVGGYASYGDFRPFQGYRFTVENSVYVSRPLRGNGIAAALMMSLIE